MASADILLNTSLTDAFGSSTLKANGLELLDAQRSAYATRQTLLNLKPEEFSSAAGLYHALGGED